MTLRYKLGAEQRDRIAATLRAKPMPVGELAAVIGCHVTNVRSAVSRMCADGDLFTCRVRAQHRAKHEVWAFADMGQRDAFATECAARSKALQKQYQASYRTRNRELHAERARRARAQAAARKAEVKARELAPRLERAQAEKVAADIRRAEREIAKQRERMEREARAAEKARAQAEAKKTRDRLKAETKAAGKLTKPDNTARPAPVRVATAPRNDLPIIIPEGVRITRAPTPPDRWAVANPAPIVNSRECRAWAKAVTA